MFPAPDLAIAKYFFRNVIDTTGPLSAFQSASINQTGTVAFAAQLDSGGEGIFTFDGKTLRTIADTNGEFSALSGLVVNAAGFVAFRADYDAGLPAQGQTIFVGDGQTLLPIVDTSGQFFQLGGLPAANDSGAVVFRAQRDDGVWGIYHRAANGSVVTIADDPGPFQRIALSYFENVPSINNDGTVAFAAWLDSGEAGIFVSSSGTVDTLVDSSGPLANFGWNPVISDDGSVVFSASPDVGRNGIYLHSNGMTQPIANDSKVAFQLHSPVVNGFGDVAFGACYHDLDGCVVRGILTGDDPLADQVIRDGDILFDAIVTDISFYRGLNNNSEIAFAYELDSGVSGIAIATPTPIGDYNADLHVDAADYVVWRDSIGSPRNLSADGNRDNKVDAADYSVWRANFGARTAAWPVPTNLVPEPLALWPLAIPFVFLRMQRATYRHVAELR